MAATKKDSKGTQKSQKHTKTISAETNGALKEKNLKIAPKADNKKELGKKLSPKTLTKKP
jgi:hypothetical protein